MSLVPVALRKKPSPGLWCPFLLSKMLAQEIPDVLPLCGTLLLHLASVLTLRSPHTCRLQQRWPYLLVASSVSASTQVGGGNDTTYHRKAEAEKSQQGRALLEGRGRAD